MRQIKENFRKNGQTYELIDRSGEIALFGIKGAHINDYVTYEVVRIYEKNDQSGHREVITDNGKFGKDGSLSFNKLEQAKEYYEELKAKYNASVSPM